MTAYRRIRIYSCEVCGRAARGRRHRRCDDFRPVGYRSCAYCFDDLHSRGTYHNACQPDRSEYAVFPDLPLIVQRRCTGCREWFPFASVAGEVVNEDFPPRGVARSGRPVFGGRCRACLAQVRRDRGAVAA